jgi:hypothetical protein
MKNDNRVSENLESCGHHSAQARYELELLESDLRNLQNLQSELLELARNPKSSRTRVAGGAFIAREMNQGPEVDTGAALASIQGRLRGVARNLEDAERLLAARRAEVARLLA